MKKLLTSPEAAFSGIPGAAKPFGTYSESARAPEHEAQTNLQNPVILTLPGLDQPPPEADPYNMLRIANEIMQQLGRAIEEAPRSLNGDATRAPSPERSEEKVKRTCTELQAYLDLFAEEKVRRAIQPQQQTPPMNGPVSRNPVLAALAGSHN